MDLNSLDGTFKVFGTAITLLNQAKDLLPQGDKKKAAEKAIVEAEEKLGLFKASVAQELGYELCKCTFPPQIMLTMPADRHKHKCPECDNLIDKTPFIGGPTDYPSKYDDENLF